MESFDFFRTLVHEFQPKTPAAALQSYKKGFSPIEMVVFKSGSTKPLKEEPFDMEAIERFLSRKDLDLEANLLLIGIFEKMIDSRDQEIALFAAESINIIENRYNSKIEKLKEIKEPSTDILSSLGMLFFDLALINESRESIKKFYFRESYSYFKKVNLKRNLKDYELKTVIRIMLDLGLYENALDFLNKRHTERDMLFLMLKAQILFTKKDFKRLFEVGRELLTKEDELDERDKALVYYWMGKNG